MRQEKTIPSWAQFGIPASHIEPEQLLVAFFSSSHVGLAIRDAQLRYELVNDALAAMNRIPSEAHIGKTVRELFGSAVAEHISAHYKRCS